MADDDSSNVLDTDRRFEIFVPSPKARINLGAPNLTGKDEGPFGYTGLSLQSDVHLFIDANKHTLFQTGQNYCGQVGGKWLQYSNSDMIISSTANANFSADKKIVIASGAGQGQITALDHGKFPRVVGYNGLGLCYTVDQIQTSLFEFFHGRRERDKPNRLLAALQADDYFDHDGKGSTDKATAINSKLAGGFINNSTDSLRDLYPVATLRVTHQHQTAVGEDGDPVALLDGLVNFGVVKSKEAKLKYGFSKYLNRFDPYAQIDTKDPKLGFLAKKLAGFKNLMAKLRRFADVVMKYADLMTNNSLARIATNALDAQNNLLAATWNAYHAFGPEGSISTLPDHFADERKSGWEARLGNSTDLDAAGDSARAAVTNQQASIQTAQGPWDLSEHGASHWTMTIAWSGGTTTVTLSDEREPAVLPITFGTLLAAQPAVATIDASAIEGETGTVVIEVNGVDTTLVFTDQNNTDVATVTAAVTAALTGKAVTVAESSGTITITTTGAGANEHLEVRFTNGEQLSTIEDQTVDGTDSEAGDLVLSINGTPITVPLDPTNTATASALRGALAGFTGTTAAGDGPITLTTALTGEPAYIEVDGATGAHVLSRLGLSAGQRVQGTEPVDLSAVTAGQIAAFIQADGVSTSTSFGHLTIKDDAKGVGSSVEASGALADEIFGDNSKSNRVTADEAGDAPGDRAHADGGYKQLISWNHEIQKLPEDTRNLMRPVRNALNDCIAAVGALDSAASVLNEVLPSKSALPSPPESIGLFANEGITLGSQDRIVGSGGKGIVFIADGGSGTEDHGKFVPALESFVNAAMGFDLVKAILRSEEPEATHPQSLGFRVLSDSTVDLMGTNAVQLMALGRGKLAAADDEGRTVAGIGVARVAGSYAAEVAGYRKVVVSARSAGDSSKDGSGGRVELAGQTIMVGGMNLQGDVEDFMQTKGIGIEPADVAQSGLASHLEGKELAGLNKDFKAYGWSETLRQGGASGHPNTHFVRIHAEKESTMVVGAYMVHVTAKEGYTLGTRTKDKDATKNVVDTAKPHFLLTDKAMTLSVSKDKTGLFLEEKIGYLQHTKDGAYTAVEANIAGVYAGTGSHAFVEVEKTTAQVGDGSGNGLILKSGNVDIIGKALKFNGSNVKIC